MNWPQYLSLETKQLGLKLALPFLDQCCGVTSINLRMTLPS